ncbi:FAD-dependent oxidoreductase [Jiangella rhizosphaerae]|uniref:FAD-dependent oxidoreductase n=1 Tax=Jiangella rhizosphaerae TaxID=2293569 RepID=A0A418KN97_9ACTN|nr:FAD-dependent oxidoreductase [Jiangella rhizosphaerae]
MRPDVAIIGGGLGGVAAALSVLRLGRTVVLTEPTAWLGGQLTAQGVPPDEHLWVEQFGVTRTYRALRDGIRAYYRAHYPLSAAARADGRLNPGRGNVSRLCHEPRVAVAVIEQLLAPYRSSGRLTVLHHVEPSGVDVAGDTVRAVVVRDDAGDETRIEAPIVLDATETGDLLPLAGAEYVTGSESHADTGEPHAPAVADPLNMQAVTWCFAFDHVAGDHTIPRPPQYDHWRSWAPDFWGAPLLSFVAPDPRTLEPVARTMHVNPDPRQRPLTTQDLAGDKDLWVFRRIAARATFEDGFLASDIVLANWPMLDYLGGPITETADAAEHLAATRSLSLSYVHWLQTEAPRPDGGHGWPGLRLRGDVLGTSDGLAMAPYIRESRRIRALRTIVEQDISVEAGGTAEPARFDDSVGVGMYRIDIHPTTGGDNYIDVECRPFEIPLTALVPVRLANLLPAGKNIGTTHITNGAYRLHPVEWNIGESAGALAVQCLETGLRPQDVALSNAETRTLQATLTELGVELHWPDVRGY